MVIYKQKISKKPKKSVSSSERNSLDTFPNLYGVLSLELAKSMPVTTKNKSYKKMQNRKRQRIDPRENPYKIYSQELNTEFLLV